VRREGFPDWRVDQKSSVPSFSPSFGVAPGRGRLVLMKGQGDAKKTRDELDVSRRRSGASAEKNQRRSRTGFIGLERDGATAEKRRVGPQAGWYRVIAVLQNSAAGRPGRAGQEDCAM
jgi:hypothetical protein